MCIIAIKPAGAESLCATEPAVSLSALPNINEPNGCCSDCLKCEVNPSAIFLKSSHVYKVFFIYTISNMFLYVTLLNIFIKKGQLFQKSLLYINVRLV